MGLILKSLFRQQFLLVNGIFIWIENIQLGDWEAGYKESGKLDTLLVELILEARQ